MADKYPELSKISDLKDNLSTSELFLIKEMLESIKEETMQELKDNINIFLNDVVKPLSDRGILLTYTWKTLLMSFIWQVRTVPSLVKLVEERK